MLIFKCKICGGNIPAQEGATFGTCESCGSTTTIPKANDEKLANLFNRANHYRRLNEFDRAKAAYEKILNEDSGNAEAHWGITLCRYGIEYVEDPRTNERIPTFHRLQYKSILTDADYLLALDNASDSYVRGLYEQEAQKISEIQKGILAISNKEEPYDVFICYKETNESGGRTVDSTIAQDIYHNLTGDGYRVFFARITLEDKLGQQYEPYIFSALNSAKVMLVIGTRKEYFEAMWVKNEWSRFLALMKNDRSKLFIPCYRDIDPYELPDEMASLSVQAQNMGSIGFIQDLRRNIKKVLNNDAQQANQEPATGTAASGPGAAASGIKAQMMRGYLALEDKEWKKANEFFENVLNIDPQNAPAYIGQLLAARNLTNEEALNDCGCELDNEPAYQKALRFANDAYKQTLMGYAYTSIKNMLLREAIEKAKSISGLPEAIRILENLADFKNADGLLLQCEKQQKHAYERACALLEDGKYGESLDLFKQLGDYEDSIKKAEHAKELFEGAKREEEAKSVEKTLETLRSIASEQEEAAKKRRELIGKREAEIQKLREEAVQKEAELIKKKKEQERQYEEEMENWVSYVAKKRELYDIWQSQGRCAHCGGEMGGLISKKCKSCSMPPGVSLELPAQPLKPIPINTAVEIDNISDAFDDNIAAIPDITVQLGGHIWRVLDIQDGKALILSDKIIETRPYNEFQNNVTWETCMLRKYLNGEFYNMFNSAERAIIAEVQLENKDNQWYGISGGNATTDKVFLLSVEEVVKYFGDSRQLKYRPQSDSYWIDDQFNDKRLAYDASGAASWWLLRSPGSSDCYAAAVSSFGFVLMSGFSVSVAGGGVRPALWLNF